MRHTILVLVVLALHAVMAAPSRAQLAPSTVGNKESASGERVRRIARATRLNGELRMDGRLDESAWGGAEPMTDFVQRQPRPGAAASERTEVRILYDDEAIYVGFRLYDGAPDSIVALTARRDGAPYSDWAYVMLDSHGDRRNAFVFAVNPAGVKKDYLITNDINEDIGWDAVWDVATTVDSAGWTAEFRIPLSQLRFNTTGGEWGLNLQRRIARRNEWSFWSPTPPNAPGLVSSFGSLEGLTDLRSRHYAELQPYALARVRRAPQNPGNPFSGAGDHVVSGGLDARYGLTSDVALSVTVNPDFGQVEADPSVVNLTAYETFFPEKRPFFIEGTDIFNFPIGLATGDYLNEQLFYSRRIGRAPHRDLSVLSPYVDQPAATTIFGAAKISGKTASGWSVGLLNALTAPEEGRYVVAGAPQTVPVEPLTNYAVMRVAKRSGNGAAEVSGIFTAANRRLDDNAYTRTLHSSAFTEGISGRYRFGGGRYELTSWLLGSRVAGSPDALMRTQLSSVRYFQRPDAKHLSVDSTRTTLTGMAGHLQLTKMGGGNWFWSAIGQARSPGFEINDLGYQRNADIAFGAGTLGYLDFTPGRYVRLWTGTVTALSQWTFGGERTSTFGALFGNIEFANFWGTNGTLLRNASSLSTGTLRGGPAIVTAARTNVLLSANTDLRRPISLQTDVSVMHEDETGGWSSAVTPRVTIRTSSRSDLSLGVTMARNVDAWQFLPSSPLDGRTRYIGAGLDQTTASVTARGSYAFTPGLTLQVYLQPFISAGKYSVYRLMTEPRASAFRDRFSIIPEANMVYSPAENAYRVDMTNDGTPDMLVPRADFNVRNLQSNTVLRWEYRPGSTVFLVWSQRRQDLARLGAFDVRNDASALFGAPSTNVLLLKVSYWLGT